MMIPTSVKIVFVGLVAVVGIAALLALHHDNSRMRRGIVDCEQRYQLSARIREENTRLKDLLDSNVAAVQAQLQQARAEVAAMEMRAIERHAEKIAQAANLANTLETNRDPSKGFVRLEHFRDSGQATPTAALETLVWAALKGDETALAKVATMSPATRAQAEALIARLSDDARARWTPDKLAELWVTGVITDVSAMQVTGESFTDSEHATVTFCIPSQSEAEKVKLKLGKSGWKVVLPSGAMEKLEKKLSTPTP